MVVKSDAWADDVDHHGAVVRDGGFQHREKLLLVTREAAADEGRTELDGQRAGVDGREVVNDAGLELRAAVGGRGELALGEAVDAVVFDDVNDRHIAADHVDELADADGSGVTIAGDADGLHRLVGEQGACRDRWHAAVHGIEGVRARHEVGGAL